MSDTAQAEFQLGEEAKRFMESSLGLHIMGVAKQEVELAMLDLLEADPADLVKVRAIQLRAACGARFKDWLFRIIADGDQAMVNLLREKYSD